MSDSLFGSGGGCGLAGGRDYTRRKTPRVVLGGGPGFAAHTAEQLRLFGWDVCTAATGDDLLAFALRKNPAAVILPAETASESGFLTAAKLKFNKPKLRVVLVGEPSDRARRLAGFVGAELASEATAADAVMKLI